MPFLEKTSFTLLQSNEHLRKIKQHEENGHDLGQIRIIESYLVQYTLVAFYSEMESELAEIVRNRLSIEGDAKISQFLYNLNEKMIKRAKTAEIKSFLKNFGCRQEDLLSEVEEYELALYGTAIANRHQVSHAAGASTSLSDLERAIDAAKKILSSVETCIR